MRALCWNVRGLGNPRTFPALKHVLHRYKPSLLFLSETKRNSYQMEIIRLKLNYDFCFSVGCSGYSGGLALLWNSDINISLLSYTKHHIDVLILHNDNLTWRFTRFYGHPEQAEKQYSWHLLRRLSTLSTAPWLCGGDFNEILKADEKRRGRLKNINFLSDFKDALQDCGLYDLGYQGY